MLGVWEISAPPHNPRSADPPSVTEMDHFPVWVSTPRPNLPATSSLPLPSPRSKPPPLSLGHSRMAASCPGREGSGAGRRAACPPRPARRGLQGAARAPPHQCPARLHPASSSHLQRKGGKGKATRSHRGWLSGDLAQHRDAAPLGWGAETGDQLNRTRS